MTKNTPKSSPITISSYNTCLNIKQPRKTQRAPKSCTFCAKRKIRCSKTIPCNSCIKRGTPHLCTREVVLVKGIIKNANNERRIEQPNFKQHQMKRTRSRRPRVVRENSFKSQSSYSSQNHTTTSSNATSPNLSPTESDFEMSNIFCNWDSNIKDKQKYKSFDDQITDTIVKKEQFQQSITGINLDIMSSISLDNSNINTCSSYSEIQSNINNNFIISKSESMLTSSSTSTSSFNSSDDSLINNDAKFAYLQVPNSPKSFNRLFPSFLNDIIISSDHNINYM